MNRSMKQMLSALLVVAMLAAMMVVPGIAANDAGSATYKVTADAVTVKVDETTTVNAKLVYGVNNDTYALTADTVYTVAGDAKVAVTAYALSGDTLAITVKGVEAGEGKVTVTINGVPGEVKVTVEAAVEPTPDPIVPTGELADGEYRMSVKGEGKEGTVTCADGVIPGLAWNTGAKMHADHGMQGVNGFAVTVPAGKTATLTVYTCTYGTGAPFSKVSGTATVGESEAIVGSEKDNDTKTVITGVTGTAQFALTGSAYVHCVVVELTGGASEDADYVLDISEEVAAGKLVVGNEFGEASPATQVPELGTDGFFTLITKFSGGMKVDTKEVTFADDYKGTNFIKFGGNVSDANATEANLVAEGKCVMFTTTATSTVKVWWTHSRESATLGLATVVNGEVVLAKADGAGKNEGGVSVFENVPAGTSYLFGSTTGPNLYKVTVKLAGSAVNPPVAGEVDKTALSAAIADAYTLANDTYAIKADTVTAASVTKGEKFVNQKDVDALNAAIAAAEAVAAKADATQAEVDAALADLAAAVDAFNAAVQTGTKGDSGSIVVPPAASNNARPVATTSNKTDANGNTANKTTDRNGNVTITVTDKDGEVVAKVEIPAVIPALATKFKDVPDDHWAAKSINDLAALGMVKGVADETYDMVSPVTRGSLATILFRLAQATGAASDFSDVAADAWYADAVGWAAKVGIITGKGDGTFSADESITREQLAVMLYRFAGLLGMDTKLAGELADFTDGEATSDWATEAMTWAVGAGILQGNTDKELNPTGAASRAETACMVDRFIGLVK